MNKAFVLGVWVFGFLALMAGCAMQRPPTGAAAPSPDEARAVIAASLPKGIADRAGWVNDIYTGFTAQGLQPQRENVCAVVAVIAQESNFQVDPVIAGLGAIAWREIDSRAQRAGIPALIVHTALDLRSANGKRYRERISRISTRTSLARYLWVARCLRI
jgi:Protein of unknown function (DUF1615)